MLSEKAEFQNLPLKQNTKFPDLLSCCSLRTSSSLLASLETSSCIMTLCLERFQALLRASPLTVLLVHPSSSVWESGHRAGVFQGRIFIKTLTVVL